MRVMIDIETMSTRPDAEILSIGAVDNCGRMFYVNVDAESRGYHRCDETAAWWAERPEAASVLSDDRKPLPEALQALNDWLGSAEVEFRSSDQLWARGPQFDMIILENAYRQEGIECPWKYYQLRDLRTILDLIDDDVRDELHTEYKPEIKHHAGQDALSQMWILAGAESALRFPKAKTLKGLMNKENRTVYNIYAAGFKDGSKRIFFSEDDLHRGLREASTAWFRRHDAEIEYDYYDDRL